MSSKNLVAVSRASEAEPIGDSRRNEHLAALWPLAASESREQQANNTQLLCMLLLLFLCYTVKPYLLRHHRGPLLRY